MDTIYRGIDAEIDANLKTKSLSTGAATVTSLTNTGAASCTSLTTSGYTILASTTVLTGTAPTIPATSTVVIYNGVSSDSVLPAVASSAGRLLFLKNINGTGTATVTANAAEKIDGGDGTLTLTPNKGAILFAITGGWAKLADC